MHDDDTAWKLVKPYRGTTSARIRFLSPADQQRLLDAAEGDLRDLVAAALMTGARFGELSRLQLQDFDAGNGSVFIAESKSGKARHVPLTPGGRVLYGDGEWAQTPTAAAREIFGDEVAGAGQLQAAARDAGFRVDTVAVASASEWDGFEASFRAGRERWAAAHPADPRAPALRAEMDARRAEYETVYRGVLGFTYLVLEAP